MHLALIVFTADIHGWYVLLKFGNASSEKLNFLSLNDKRIEFFSRSMSLLFASCNLNVVRFKRRTTISIPYRAI